MAATIQAQVIVADNCLRCALPIPHPSTPILTDGLSVPPAYQVGFSKILRSLGEGGLNPSLRNESPCPAVARRAKGDAFALPFIVTFLRGWTCSLIVPFPHVMLDARLGFGTLAERTSKQPGKPGTQPSNRLVPKNSRALRVHSLDGHCDRWLLDINRQSLYIAAERMR